jgi:hypothetical protein
MTLFVLTSWTVQTTTSPYQAVAVTNVPVSLSLAMQTEPPWRTARTEAVRTRPVRHGWDLHWTPQECVPQTEPGSTLTHTFPLSNLPGDPTRIGLLIESPTCALPNPSTPPLTIPPGQATQIAFQWRQNQANQFSTNHQCSVPMNRLLACESWPGCGGGLLWTPTPPAATFELTGPFIILKNNIGTLTIHIMRAPLPGVSIYSQTFDWPTPGTFTLQLAPISLPKATLSPQWYFRCTDTGGPINNSFSVRSVTRGEARGYA